MIRFTIELFDAGHFLLVPNGYNAEDLPLYQHLPERKWINNGEMRGWKAPINAANMEYISRTWKRDEYIIDENARQMMAYEKLAAKVDTLKAEKRWQYLFEGSETDFVYPYPPAMPPFQHQLVTVEAMYGAEYFGCLMDMGTGKTKCIADELSIIGMNLPSSEMFKCLIVCPKPLMVNWGRELDKNIIDEVDFVYDIFNGGNSKSLDQMYTLLNDPARMKIGIVSYRSVETLKTQLKLFRPHMLVCDESHNIKNCKTKSWKAVKEVADFSVQRRILTGTVTCNNILDIWAQFEILKPGALGYSTYEGFKNHFCEVEKVGENGEFEKIVGFTNVDKLKETMARMSFTVKKEQCLDLPEKIFDITCVEMPANMRELYNQMADDFIAVIDGTTIETKVILAQMMKLSQMCSGFIIGKESTGFRTEAVHDGDGEYLCDAEIEMFEKKLIEIPGGDAKMLIMLEDAVQASTEGKVIIWSRFQYDNKRIEQRLKELGVECGRYDGTVKDDRRQEVVDRFNNDPKFRCFIGNPAAGGTGLTLLGDTRDGANPRNRTKNVFYYSNDFSFNKRVQSEDRCHRIGLRNPVLYRDYVYEKSIEQFIAEVLQAKKDLADEVKNVFKIKDLLIKQKEG